MNQFQEEPPLSDLLISMMVQVFSWKKFKIWLNVVDVASSKISMKNLTQLWIHYWKRILLVEVERKALSLQILTFHMTNASDFTSPQNYQIQNILLKSWVRLWWLTSLSQWMDWNNNFLMLLSVMKNQKSKNREKSWCSKWVRIERNLNNQRISFWILWAVLQAVCWTVNPWLLHWNQPKKCQLKFLKILQKVRSPLNKLKKLDNHTHLLPKEEQSFSSQCADFQESVKCTNTVWLLIW